jgi:hypothetical protein
MCGNSSKASIKETHMSSITNLSSVSSVLAQLNARPHGHKKGPQADAVGSADDTSSGTAAKAPSGATQNLFGSLLKSLEQVIGLQSGTATPSGTAANASRNSQANGSQPPGVVGSNINVNA